MSPRLLHPGAWWVWSLGLAVAASRTTNPLLLALIVVVLSFVVAMRRPNAWWGRSFSFFIRLAIAVVVIRLLVQLILGPRIGTHVLVSLPGMQLPDVLATVRLGGDVMLEGLLMALFDGLRLATILLCIGAANALASPSRLLKSVPAALYEIGVSIVVALTFTPQLVADVDRVRQARRLRGRRTTGVRAIAGAVMPVLEGALERSVGLAAAMDARGYGRRGTQPARERRVANMLLLGGLVAACIGTYGLVAPAPVWLGLPLLGLGLLACMGALTLAGRTRVRSNYRPDPWSLPEWLVASTGILAAITCTAAAWAQVAGMQTPWDPPTLPLVPIAPALAVLLAGSAAFTSPPIPTVRTAVPSPVVVTT
jgi:energy-coupling factor transport system permease protein